MADSSLSSLTSVFHELLGDGAAKEVANQQFLLSVTRQEGASWLVLREFLVMFPARCCTHVDLKVDDTKTRL